MEAIELRAATILQEQGKDALRAFMVSLGFDRMAHCNFCHEIRPVYVTSSEQSVCVVCGCPEGREIR